MSIITQLCIRREFLSAEQRDLLSMPPRQLPPWDSMGALAKTFDPREGSSAGDGDDRASL